MHMLIDAEGFYSRVMVDSTVSYVLRKVSAC